MVLGQVYSPRHYDSPQVSLVHQLLGVARFILPTMWLVSGNHLGHTILIHPRQH